MSYYLVGLALLSTLCLADKPSSDYGAPAQDYEPPVKYGGPIVYSGEKPPIIHFPPPPSDTVSYNAAGKGKGGSPPAIKYVPLPHHDLPVLIYTSDSQPPIHVVHTPKPAGYDAPKVNYQEPKKPVYKKPPPPPKPKYNPPKSTPKPTYPPKKPSYTPKKPTYDAPKKPQQQQQPNYQPPKYDV